MGTPDVGFDVYLDSDTLGLNATKLVEENWFTMVWSSQSWSPTPSWQTPRWAPPPNNQARMRPSPAPQDRPVGGNQNHWGMYPTTAHTTYRYPTPYQRPQQPRLTAPSPFVPPVPSNWTQVYGQNFRGQGLPWPAPLPASSLVASPQVKHAINTPPQKPSQQPSSVYPNPVGKVMPSNAPPFTTQVLKSPEQTKPPADQTASPRKLLEEVPVKEPKIPTQATKYVPPSTPEQITQYIQEAKTKLLELRNNSTTPELAKQSLTKAITILEQGRTILLGQPKPDDEWNQGSLATLEMVINQTQDMMRSWDPVVYGKSNPKKGDPRYMANDEKAFLLQMVFDTGSNLKPIQDSATGFLKYLGVPSGKVDSTARYVQENHDLPRDFSLIQDIGKVSDAKTVMTALANHQLTTLYTVLEPVMAVEEDITNPDTPPGMPETIIVSGNGAERQIITGPSGATGMPGSIAAMV